MKPKMFTPVVLGFILAVGGHAQEMTQDYLQARPDVIEAWKDMRFGMFLCWGPVSLTGKEIGWSRGAPAWGIRKGVRGGKGPTPAEVYDNLYKKWKPDKFDAEHWVKVAKAAGQKYLIFLLKHHDGFCLYDTKLTDYRSTGPESAWKVDVMKAVADACHRHDLKLIVYYSQPDWHHPDYLGEHHDRYVEYLHGQVRELLTNYGKIDGLWFDNLRGRGNNIEAAKLWDAEKLFKMARSIQPHLIINDRCGLDADYYTPEQHVGSSNTERAWESCITLGTQWSWKPNDKLKSFTEAIKMLVVCAVGDGNLALNTNPMPDGRIEPRQVESFKRIGKWMKKYGESIYGTRGGPFIAPEMNTRKFGSARNQFNLPGGRWWGGSTHKANVVYLHILRWPGDTIVLPDIGCKVMSHSVLTGGTAVLRQTVGGTEVSMSPDRRNSLDTIVKIEFDKSVTDVKPLVALPAAQITFKETRQKNGHSEIRIVDNQGRVKARYPINLTTHYHPATSADDPVIKRWKSWKYGAFLCFNSNQFSGQEFCRIRDPQEYAPAKLDVRQWIDTFKAAGMRYAVLTARHTSGFLLWDSPTSEHDITNSRDTTDVVKEYVEECRRQDIEPGIYYCLWGGKGCSLTGHRKIHTARALILAQLYELATCNGPIPYFWIDMKNWAPQDLSAQEIYDLLKNINPQTVVILNQHIQRGTEIKYFPTDVLNGEMMMPPESGHQAFREVNGKRYYLPFEYEPCSQHQQGPKWKHKADYGDYVWFTYGKGKGFAASKPFPAQLLHQYISAAYHRGTSNVLLSCAPDHTGRFREEDIKQMVELGRMLRSQ